MRFVLHRQGKSQNGDGQQIVTSPGPVQAGEEPRLGDRT